MATSSEHIALDMTQYEHMCRETFFMSVLYRDKRAASKLMRFVVKIKPMYTSYEFDVWIEKASRLLKRLLLPKSKGYWRATWEHGRPSKENHLWRIACLERDDWQCQHCKATKKLNIHHIKSYKNHSKLRTIIENGITLCQTCHIMEHKRIRSGQ